MTSDAAKKTSRHGICRLLESMDLALILPVASGIVSILASGLKQNEPYQICIVKPCTFWFKVFETPDLRKGCHKLPGLTVYQ